MIAQLSIYSTEFDGTITISKCDNSLFHFLAYLWHEDNEAPTSEDG